MWKKYKTTILITSIIILLPMVMGLLLWDQLPDQIATHFNVNGEADQWSSKSVAVFGFPCLFLGIHFLSMFASTRDSRVRSTSPKMLRVMLWICPAIAVLVTMGIYSYAMGKGINFTFMAEGFLGLLFVFVGNYMPKFRQNAVIGIKIPWTLADEENWERTHRMASRLWLIGGICMILDAFLQWGGIFTFFIITLLLVVIPSVYSFIIYQKKHK